jgi:hypothetical protein
MKVIYGSKPDEGQVMPTTDVVIIGESSLSGWTDFLTGQIAGLVVDEAHHFKNANKRTAALVQLATGIKRERIQVSSWNGKAKYQIISTNLNVPLPNVRVLMSGTPTPNGRHQELATQVDVLGNRAWRDIGGKGVFFTRYAPKLDEYGNRGNGDSEELFERMTQSWFHRRLRDGVLDLPNKGRISVAFEGRGKAVRQGRGRPDAVAR